MRSQPPTRKKRVFNPEGLRYAPKIVFDSMLFKASAEQVVVTLSLQEAGMVSDVRPNEGSLYPQVILYMRRSQAQDFIDGLSEILEAVPDGEANHGS